MKDLNTILPEFSGQRKHPEELDLREVRLEHGVVGVHRLVGAVVVAANTSYKFENHFTTIKKG